jgi:hypothetical protein
VLFDNSTILVRHYFYFRLSPFDFWFGFHSNFDFFILKTSIRSYGGVVRGLVPFVRRTLSEKKRWRVVWL